MRADRSRFWCPTACCGRAGWGARIFTAPLWAGYTTDRVKISEILIRTTAHLAQRFPDTARVEAEWILSALLDISRTEIYLRSGETFPADLVSRLEEIIISRLQANPLQYLLGFTEFYGRRFACDARALIPRPETEILVLSTLAHLNATFPPRNGVHPPVWDIGTGSGNIAVTLACERRDLLVLATDTDAAALQLARENAQLCRVADRVIFAAGSLCDAVAPAPRFAAMCSNPPYVSECARDTLPADVRDFEPPQALFAPENGLCYLREIISRAADHLAHGGLLALEIGYDQSDAVRTLLFAHGAYDSIKLTKDLAGHLRVASAVRI